MDITIIGYGKMGREVESILRRREHNILDKYDMTDNLQEIKKRDTLCIDFTSPDAFKTNYKIIADKFGGAVVGTTGWNEIEDEVIEYFKSKNKKLVYASNFSIGVNIFFDAVEKLALLTSRAGNYDPFIIEMHHKEKKDAPSGTAKTTESIVETYYKRKIPPVSIRSGNIRGIHEVGFDSETDKIILKHEAHSREGFALGSVIAAEWLDKGGGIWEFRKLLDEKLNLKQ